MGKVLGVTGGIGTGKSTVLRILGELGAVTLSADDIARDVLSAGTPAYREVVRRFGPEVVAGEGGIDRAALARIIFSDPEARAALDAITHPEIIARVHEHIRRFRESNPPTGAVLAVEIPLLIECGMEDAVDEVLLVAAEQRTQVGRLTSRSGITPDEARCRIAAQMPLSEKVKRSDLVVNNDGTFEELEASMKSLWGEISCPA